jgi:hypothetical protein
MALNFVQRLRLLASIKIAFLEENIILENNLLLPRIG